jgi:hypothetical protein
MARHPRLRRVLLLAGITGLGAPTIGAQQARTPGPTASQDPVAAVGAMMQSHDPRQQAWGAWYAGRDRIRELVPELRKVLAQRLYDHSTTGAAALDIALDGLIEMKQPPPAGMISMVFERRPVQALILASSADDDIDGFLFHVLRETTHDSWFAAANLLLRRRAPGLASELLKGLRLDVKAVLVDRGHGFGGSRPAGGGAGCGAGGRRSDGLPPWPTYDLTTHSNTGVSVLAMGPVPVFYRRIVATTGQTPAFCDGFTNGPAADHRIQYLGQLAGLDERALPLRGYEFHSIEAQDDATAEAGIRRVKSDVVRRYAQLMSLLVDANLLPSEMAVRPPDINLEVLDHRTAR